MRNEVNAVMPFDSSWMPPKAICEFSRALLISKICRAALHTRVGANAIKQADLLSAGGHGA